MRREDKYFIIMAVLLSVAAVFSVNLYCGDFRQRDTVQIKNFPREIGAWSVSEDIPLSSLELAILETDNVFIRKYKNPQGQEAYLYIVYSQGNHKVSHPPEICYTGSGVSILEKTRDIIAVNYKGLNISANRLLLQAGQRYQISFYWFKVGNTFTSSYWKEQTLVALSTLWGKRQGSALIRISVDLTNKNQETAIGVAKDFANLIIPQAVKYLP